MATDKTVTILKSKTESFYIIVYSIWTQRLRWQIRMFWNISHEWYKNKKLMKHAQVRPLKEFITIICTYSIKPFTQNRTILLLWQNANILRRHVSEN